MATFAVLLLFKTLLESLLVDAHHLHPFVHAFIVVFIIKNAGEGYLHDSGVHKDNIEDSFHGSPVVLLGLLTAIDDNPSHSPPWSQVSLGQP